MDRAPQYDAPAIWLTFVFLAFVAFFPVPSGILGDYDYTSAVVFFTLVLAGCGYSLLGLWLYISGRGHLLRERFPRQEIVHRSINLSVIPSLFLLSLLLAPIWRFDPSAIILTWLLIPPLMWLIHRLRRRSDAHAGRGGEANAMTD
jgi:uncharacterized membrane protein